jgi:hypothetical protein
MGRFILAAIVLSLCVANASATVPDPDECSVSPCDDFIGMILYPDPISGGAAEFVVNVRNDDSDPFPNAYVEIVFGTPGNHTLCSDAVLTGNTGPDGSVTFAISGGGCTLGADAVRIYANGIVIRIYEAVKSPDYAPGSNGNVELGDFIYFGSQMSAGAVGCADYYNSGETGLGSFIVFGEAWTHVCP